MAAMCSVTTITAQYIGSVRRTAVAKSTLRRSGSDGSFRGCTAPVTSAGIRTRAATVPWASEIIARTTGPRELLLGRAPCR